LETVARAVPEVEIAEAYRRAGVNLVTDDSGAVAVREGRRMLLCGYPIGTQLLHLPLREGRWPTAENASDVVINRQVQEAARGLQLGSEITIKFRERLARVRVAGIVEEIGSPVIYAAFPTFEKITGLGDASGVVRVKARNGRERLAAGALEQALLDAHLTPGLVNTKTEFRASLDEHFAVVGTVMKMIALASAFVGAITLVATVSLGVLERGREIGVIRAIGAAPRAVIAIFLVEGGGVALLSATLSVAGGIFFARFLNRMAAEQLLHVAVPLSISPVGIAILGSGGIVVILAVWMAAARMLRLSVRDALAYE
jgi:putative ABC transport system permease protein